MTVSRRNFLKYAGGLAAAAGVPSLLFTVNANAAINPNPKKLVVLTLNGGNDGLNMVIPIDADQYALYQGYRPIIGIPMANILPIGANASGRQFGFHPAMASLMPYLDKLALFPTAHTGPASNNQSHFYQQDLINAGLHKNNPTPTDGRGWVGRYLDAKYASQPEGVVAQDFAVAQPLLFRTESTFVFASSDPASLALGTDATTSSSMWADILARQNPEQMGGYAGTYASRQESLKAAIDRVGAVNFLRSTSAVYPTTGIGNDFNKAADMLVALPELESIHIIQGGYDTHSNQGGVTGSQATLLTRMSDALAAFYADLSSLGMANDVIVVVKSEFGRTTAENTQDATAGTDHGEATCWMAFGGAVRGGVYGGFAGLELSNLATGRYLMPMVDYRDILSEVMGRFMASSTPNAYFPGYAGAATPLGFIL